MTPRGTCRYVVAEERLLLQQQAAAALRSGTYRERASAAATLVAAKEFTGGNCWPVVGIVVISFSGLLSLFMYACQSML